MDKSPDVKLKEYVGYIWIGDQPGIPLSVMAAGPLEAVAAVKAQYGEHPMSLWNEEEAERLRHG